MSVARVAAIGLLALNGCAAPAATPQPHDQSSLAAQQGALSDAGELTQGG